MQSVAMIYGNIDLLCGVTWLLEHGTRGQTGGSSGAGGLPGKYDPKAERQRGLGY